MGVLESDPATVEAEPAQDISNTVNYGESTVA
jgi:hypothetical protein